MKRYTALLLFTLSIIGLLTACSKEETNVASSDPIVGQWDINRYTISDLPTSYSTLNGTVNTNLGIDTYTFRGDATYSETYSSYDGSSKGSEDGNWVRTDSVLKLTPTATSSGKTVAPYKFKYILDRGELSTGKFQTSGVATNPTTNKEETVSYSLEFFYLKRY